MAGDWIKMRGNLWDDPRVSRLVDLTDSTEASIVGALYWLWATADQHSADGLMSGLTTKAIDRKTGVQGFGDALVTIGWLADHPEGVRILRFEEHNGESAKCRVQTAKRVAKHAAKEKLTQSALAKQQESVSTALPREREEKSKPSVANATGDKSPKVVDPDEIIFGYGVPLLVSAGNTDKASRSFLGGLRKQHGDSALINSLRTCLQEKPLQPLEWLAAALPPKARASPAKTPAPDDFKSKDYGTRAMI